LAIQASPLGAVVWHGGLQLTAPHRGSIKSQGRHDGKQAQNAGEIHSFIAGNAVARKHRLYLGTSHNLKTNEMTATVPTPASQRAANHSRR
jgi:hypothetical protein